MVRGPAIAAVTPGCEIAKAVARCVSAIPASSARGDELLDDGEPALVAEVPHAGARRAEDVVLAPRAVPPGEPLRDYFDTHLTPTLERLRAAAVRSGEVRQEVDARDLLAAVANLCHGAGAEGIVALLLAGLRT